MESTYDFGGHRRIHTFNASALVGTAGQPEASRQFSFYPQMAMQHNLLCILDPKHALSLVLNTNQTTMRSVL